ncbi:MAG: hypothetical protein IVW52_05120 [Acidimicrobiales bacterium]|nr:hypothetical protein [Acidimicrobiales bacterium]
MTLAETAAKIGERSKVHAEKDGERAAGYVAGLRDSLHAIEADPDFKLHAKVEVLAAEYDAACQYRHGGHLPEFIGVCEYRDVARRLRELLGDK